MRRAVVSTVVTTTPDRGGTVPDERDVWLRSAFSEHRRELHVHCYRLAGNVADADDLVQETFLRAWRARSRFEGRASARTWLYRIATNVFLDSRRRPRGAPCRPVTPWSGAPSSAPIPTPC